MKTQIGIRKLDHLLLKIGRYILDFNLNYNIQDCVDEALVLLKKEGEQLDFQEALDNIENIDQLLSQSNCKDSRIANYINGEILGDLIEIYLKIIDFQIESNNTQVFSLVPKGQVC